MDFRALLIGDDYLDAAYVQDLKQRIERTGLAERAFIVDRCRDLPAAMMLADVVVSTSESPLHFDRVFAQAQAMGRPVVASEHGSAAEQAARGAMVWLTPPGNAYSVAQAVESALRYPAAERLRLAQLAQNGDAPSIPATPPPSAWRSSIDRRSTPNGPSNPPDRIFLTPGLTAP